MVGASRSGKQNIIEGSERAKTSSETEIKLTDVAKASLCELQGDLEDYLTQKGSVPWGVQSPDHRAILAIKLGEFAHTDDCLHDYWTFLLAEKKKLDRWIESPEDITAANALIVLIQRATGVLGRQLEQLDRAFVTQGGIKEKMSAARREARTEPGASQCPECGQPMRRRESAKGAFWGCGNYPTCRRTRPVTS